MNWIIGLTLSAAVLALVVWKRIASRLGPEEQEAIRAALAKGALVLDVRTPAEFAQGHLDGATNIPLEQLMHDPGAVGKRSRPVVVYCHSGSRSRVAVSLLQQKGHKRALDLRVMRNWAQVSPNAN